MPIGFNLLYRTTTLDDDALRFCERVKEAGYDGVEVPIHSGEVEDFARARPRLADMGLACTAITSVHAEANPTSPDPAVRRKALDHLRWAVDSAAALESPVLGGPFHSAYAHFTGEPPTNDELARSAEVLRAAGDHARAAGVVLCAEVLNRFECYLLNTVADTLAWLDQVDHPSVRLHYDTHHAHIEEQDPAAALRAAGPRLGHVHVSENDRGTPGAGQVDWDTTFAALEEVGYEGWIVVEAFSRHDPAFANAIHVWRDYAESADALLTEGLAFLRARWPR